MAKEAQYAKKYIERWALQEVTGTTIVKGQQVQTWATYRSVWAASTEVTSAEIGLAMGLHEKCSHLVEMRFYDRITSQHRLTRKGRILNILGVTNPDGRRIETRLACLEIKPKA